MRFYTFLGIAIGLVVLLNLYVLAHARRALGQHARRGSIVLLVFLVLGAIASVTSRLAARSMWTGWTTWAVFGLAVELAVFITTVLLFVVDGGRAVNRIGHWVARKIAKSEDAKGNATPFAAVNESALSETPPLPVADAVSPSRRDFIENAASLSALAIGASSSAYGVFFGRHDYAIETVPVRIPGLPATLDGYTIVQLSDIHFGPFVGEPELRAAVDRVRRARPDLVVLTGDLIDHDLDYVSFLGRLIEQLKPLARDGVAVIPGNHDYYTGVSEVLRTATRAGGHVLVNHGRVIGAGRDAFALLGVDDLWARRNGTGRGPNLDHAISTVPRDLPRILLSHNPAFFPEAAGRVALQLSGHTHGGQLNVGLALTSHLMPFGYIAGMYQRDGSQLYVNRGFGTAGPPARIGSSPEISRFILTSDARV
ncbi:MAG: metallophosphoesterase [Sandaracinaceae bacterium]|nr:metallophosphoesterase [Sandaracinaceae bacterium]